jgi:hypothetical protein
MKGNANMKNSNPKKGILFKFLTLLVITIFLFISWLFYDIYNKKSSISLSEFLAQEDYEGLRLTIFYLYPHTLTWIPLNIDGLTGGLYEYKITIQGIIQEEDIFEILTFLADIDLVPVENESRIDARIYYVFETEKGQKLFDVAMWGENESLYVNGVEVEENYLFYEVIRPYLPVQATEFFDFDLFMQRETGD